MNADEREFRREQAEALCAEGRGLDPPQRPSSIRAHSRSFAAEGIPHTIEALAARAWPAEVCESLDGWLLRFNHGVTRRANSVLPIADGGELPLDRKLEAVERFYRQRGVTPRFQISPAVEPPELDRVLEERGYTSHARTCVQTAPTQRVLAVDAGGHRVSISPAPCQEWLLAYREVESADAGGAAVRHAIIERIEPPTAYARLDLDGQVAAIGLTVAEAEWSGLFAIGTRAGFRRRGCAAAIMRSLAEWSEQRGAAQLYLQVMEGNTPALALYAGLGFETLYHYHYREMRL
jgi:N-acetylglutamate synthase